MEAVLHQVLSETSSEYKMTEVEIAHHVILKEEVLLLLHLTFYHFSINIDHFYFRLLLIIMIRRPSGSNVG